jgi:hypothetical protein
MQRSSVRFSVRLLPVAVLLLCPAGAAFHGWAQGAEPTVEELKKEIAELRELLKYQGTWKRAEDGTQVIIEGEKWTWILPDGKVNNSGKLKVIEVGKEKTKVDWARLTGDGKGTTAKTIMHSQGEDTLQFRGSGDDYPTEFQKDSEFKRAPR